MKSLNQVWVTDNGNQGELVSLAVKPVRGKGGGAERVCPGEGGWREEAGGRGWPSFMACVGNGTVTRKGVGNTHLPCP